MKRHVRVGSRIADELAILSTCDRTALLHRWREVCTVPPPVHMSTKLLLQVVAYKLQERVYGGLTVAVKRFMEKAAADFDSDFAVAAGKAVSGMVVAKVGTRLVREWRGIVYEVVIEQDGVLLNGERVRSLSAAAHKITGAKWSGPRFFGLVKGG